MSRLFHRPGDRMPTPPLTTRQSPQRDVGQAMQQLDERDLRENHRNHRRRHGRDHDQKRALAERNEANLLNDRALLSLTVFARPGLTQNRDAGRLISLIGRPVETRASESGKRNAPDRRDADRGRRVEDVAVADQKGRRRCSSRRLSATALL